jgi:hypothetical protein
MSDTPETDGLEFKSQLGMMPPYDTVPAEFARRLERERDRALKALSDIEDWRAMGTIAREFSSENAQAMASPPDKIIPELIRRREAKDRSREIITKLASKAKEEQP